MMEPEFTSDAAATFARLATTLHSAPGVAETVDAVAEFALDAVGCHYVGVSLALPGERPEIVATTDPIIERVLRRQLTVGEGPMLAALSESATVHVPDPAAETRWPEWRRFVRDLPLGSFLHVPLQTNKGVIGVLSLYHERTFAFSADDEAIAHVLARHAAVAVATARQESALAAEVDARKLVGVAMGILMERYNLTGDEAFATLRRYSQDTNTKLREVAQEVTRTCRSGT